MLVTGALLLWSVSVRAGEMSGSATVNYLRQEEDGEVFSSFEQRFRLNWSTALSNVDLLDLYFQFSREEQNNPDSEELRPLAGFNLRGPEYRWLVEYREFKQKDLEEGGLTLTSNTLFSNFYYEPDPDYPDLTVDFSRISTEDDAEEPQTDFVETNWGIRSTYDNGPLSVRYSHRETEFDNNLSTLTTTTLQNVRGVAVDSAGVIYATDSTANRVFRFSSSGAFLGEFGSFGSGEGQFRNPLGIDVTPSFVYVVDSDNDRVQRFDQTGTFVSEWGTFGLGAGEFDAPYGVAVDGTGVYVTDQGNDRVQKFTDAGAFLFSFGTTGSGPGNFSAPSGIASNGSLVFVADTQNHRVQVFTTAGAFVTQWGSFGSSPGQFQSPTDVALDSVNRVYVTDTGNNRVQVFTTAGAFLNEFGASGTGPGEFNAPSGIALTPADDVVVADTGNDRFQVLTSAGMFIFQVGSISGEERGRSTHLMSDSFNIIYSRELVQGVYASVDYEFFKSKEEDKDTGEELVSSLTHELTTQVRLQPYRWVSFTSLFDLELFETEAGDVKSKRDEFIQTHTLSLQPIPRVNMSATYQLANLNTNIGPDEDSTFTNLSLNLLPTDRVRVDLSYSNQQNEQENEKVLETDTFSATTDMKIYRGVDLNVQLSSSQSKDFEADGTVDSQRVRGRLRLVPRPNMTLNTTAEYNKSDSKFAGLDDVSSETIFGSMDLAWAISRRLDLFLDMDYVESKSDGMTTDRLSYLSNLVWKMNDKLTFFVGYRGGSDEEKVFSFRTQAKFPFFWDTRMSINWEIEEGQQSDSNFLFVELTKIF